jgi:hypothetical protein
MGFGLDTRKIFIGGRRGAKSKAARAAKQGRPPPTRKAPTPPKKQPSAAKQAKAKAKQNATKKAKADRAKVAKEKGSKKKAEFQKKSKADQKKERDARKKTKKNAKADKAKKAAAKKKTTKKTTKKKKDKKDKKKDKGKGSGSASFLGGPGGLSGLAAALGAGLQAAAEAAAELAKNAAEAAAAFLDTMKDLFSGASNSSGLSGNSGSINGASAENTSAEGLDGNCNAAQLKAKQDADARRNTKLEKYGTLSPSAGLTLLTQVDKAYNEELIKANITGGTCKSEKPENSEAPEKSSNTVKPTVYSISPSVPDVKFLDALNESLKVLNISEPDSIKDLVDKKDNVKNLIEKTANLDERTKIVAAAMVAFDPVNSKRYFELTKGDNSNDKEEANT